MRIHDIDLVADLNAHDPNAPSVPPPTQDSPPGETQQTIDYDGTTKGRLTTEKKIAMDESAQDAANQYLDGEWTGPWPVYHIYILSDASVRIVHISIYILFDIQLHQIGIIEWFLNALGLDTSEFEYWIGLIDEGMEELTFAVATIAFEAMVAAMMVFDYTKAPLALGVGIGLWITAATLFGVVSYHFAENLNNRVMAGWIWLFVALLSLKAIVGGLVTDKLTGDIKWLAKGIFGWLSRRGYKGAYSGKQLKFAWASLLAIAAMVSLSIFFVIAYSY